MKKLITILFAVALGLNLSAQDDCEPSPDFNQDGVVGMNDLLTLLSAFGDFDLDFDGIWDSVDDCIGVYDPCGVCSGTGEDADEDGLCDDVDDCVGEYDECGVCNGPGPTFPVIDEILYATDSVFLDPLDEWYVFEYATDTLFTYMCPVSGCTDEAAGNYSPEAVIEDGSCVYGPLECGGVSTLTYDGYTYDLVAIGNQCWFAENLRNEHYTNGDAIPESVQISGAYGRLYSWYAVDDARGLCPSGWQVPTDGQFRALEMELGMSSWEANSGGWRGTNQGFQMKSSASDTPSWNGSNTSGFSALSGGEWSFSGNSGGGEGPGGFFWTSTPAGASAWLRKLVSGSHQVNRYNNLTPDFGLSVRCVLN